ncbi:MAG: vWA domain-containing protein [Planctomycetaceae bacterium]
MSRRRTQRRGAVIVLAAVCLIAVFAFAAFTVDVGHMSLTRTQMQASADAAALAAASDLAAGESAVRSAAEKVARENYVNRRRTHLVPEEDVELGKWDDAERVFTPLLGNARDDADSVRITVKLDAARDNALPMFFAPVIGHRSTGMTVRSVATIGHPKPRDIMLVLDCSRSMLDYNRMVYTRAAALALIEELGPNDRLGLTVYNYPEEITVQTPIGNSGKFKTTTETIETGYLERPLAFDFSPVRSRVPQLTAGMYANYTNIGGGMRVGLEELLANNRPVNDPRDADVRKIMVLMTDGQANITEPPASTPVGSIDYYADLARRNNVIIHGVTLSRDAHEAPIRNAARETGGDYYHVPDGNLEGLFHAFRTIGRGDGRPKLVH